MLPILIDATVATAILILSAFGLFLVYGHLKVVNMAHGELILTGAYAAAAAQDHGAPFGVAVIAAMVAGALAALAIDLLVLGNVRRSPLATMLATWGTGLVITQSLRLVFGAGGIYVSAPVSTQTAILGTIYPTYQLWLIAAAAAVLVANWWLLARTRLGLLIRAQTDDETLAELIGIPTRALFMGMFAFAGAAAGMAGALLAPLSGSSPQAGSEYSVTAFMVVIVGGMGSVEGLVIGASAVGGGRSLLGAFLNPTAAMLLSLAAVAGVLAFRRKDDAVD